MSIQVTPNLNQVSVVSSVDTGFLAELLSLCQTQSSVVQEPELISLLQAIRDRAAAIVQQSKFPTTRDEEWRFTDLSALKSVNFQVAPSSTPNLTALESLLLPEADCSRLVFVNGVYAPDLSAVALPDNVIVSNLDGLPPTYRSRIENYLAQVPGTQEVFTALNTAAIADVAVVWIPKNIVVEKPIHLLFISTASNTPIISQPRCLVVAESNSSVTLIEDYFNQMTNLEAEESEAEVGEPVYFTNAVTEIWLAENAQVNHTRIERDSPEAFHIGKSAIAQARDSRYTCNAITLGAKLSRHNLEIFQTGEQTQTILNGLTKIAGNQLADTHSTLALNHPYGTSHQQHKCIVGDRAHAVFNGKIFVPKPAQQTDAAQLNRNLLLSPKARVDTKPQLEITADNVKCAHGATVSQLDDEEVFYLQSRGLNATDARNLLVNAFAAEIINQIPIPSLKQTLTKTINL
ncbi:Fe-S cluster assembly protein SufD [Gloeocapsopsis dulcis]|uniref:Fe-S cluster assembly protein SufD n=1 Tax=Gloeocapsopsis dulcis AAB1 = 1H9 TaxID=1433147 RepID=A0A6N8G0W8_9CHRO|nr:Fe-S cluster assembly protein SufD [Gloeocapsopsis dulcis]MUL37796.1 Fe-S cluster assembly protein SufD [Gloeocapsopsis dulcis AAB1 = 1H9]WNN90584.1 Fe-S cluster assembly protein SufD [Gloeocapsopsis dulcis]